MSLEAFSVPWPPFHSSNVPPPSRPQGLCTFRAPCLEIFYSRPYSFLTVMFLRTLKSAAPAFSSGLPPYYLPFPHVLNLPLCILVAPMILLAFNK